MSGNCNLLLLAAAGKMTRRMWVSAMQTTWQIQLKWGVQGQDIGWHCRVAVREKPGLCLSVFFSCSPILFPALCCPLVYLKASLDQKIQPRCPACDVRRGKSYFFPQQWGKRWKRKLFCCRDSLALKWTSIYTCKAFTPSGEDLLTWLYQTSRGLRVPFNSAQLLS